MKNALLEDCEQLLRNILSDAPQEHEYILAIVAKSDKTGKLPQPSKSLFPNIYGYSVDGTKNHLMLRLKVTSNVPKGASKLMKARDTTHQEEIMNLPSRVKTLDDKLNDVVFAEYAWVKNTTVYKNAELILVFRSQAAKFLDSEPLDIEDTPFWPTGTYIEGTKFVFAGKLEISFRSKLDDRFNIFSSLFEKQGKWVRAKQMSQLIGKNNHAVRTIINQIQRSKLDGSALGKVLRIEFSNKYPSAARLVYSS